MNDVTNSFIEPGLHPTRNVAVPTYIGRYRIHNVLGRGGFGVVYLAYDDTLHRPVAIKVPHHLQTDPVEDEGLYLNEARAIAALDHPNIIPIFDIGSTPQFPRFIVSKYIDGADLASRLRHERLPVSEIVQLIATVADALHYAHTQGLVHRDIKPANLLIDKAGKPFVVDFGLALRDQDAGTAVRYGGTPAYMSPEQIRGEGHRIDGRSDIFSLGVVLYQLLTGRLPFRADNREDLFEQIKTGDVRPPRQWDEAIPKELERICLKALSKRASDRFTTAKDMAEELLRVQEEFSSRVVVDKASTDSHEGESTVTVSIPTASNTNHAVVPKGLRSFDAHDVDFFLELIPGPRNRDGLPDSIRFWKNRIESRDGESTFSVGLIYGPSGCGKSSLVKAGLLPHLGTTVVTIYVESTALETETRLLHCLGKSCLSIPENLGLKDVVTRLRRGQGIHPGNKVLIVLDQFEQWLHAKKDDPHSELVEALRQCDGIRVQALVLVRDDFWMAATHFMHQLEVRLVEDENSAAVDVFPIHHAEKVLAMFGRAYGVLPANPADISPPQQFFIQQGVAALSEEGKVVPVRLALFAELMKHKPWLPATLQNVGGAQGVGVAFLDETFSAKTAPPEHRYHQKAARAILRALLPQSERDLKGQMRTRADLLEVSGYQNRPIDFEALIRILDNELRIITPTDPEGLDEVDSATMQVGGKYYQLTHDYLVGPLREWLTRKQRETRRGRAELLLAERAEVWNACPENRQLPSLWQWLEISRLTAKKRWTPAEKMMMRKAGRLHALYGVFVGGLLALAFLAGFTIHSQAMANQKILAAGLVQRLLDAEAAQVPAILAEMADYRTWTDAMLRQVIADPDVTPRRQLHASLALLQVDPQQVDYLSQRLLDAAPYEVVVIRDALLPYKDQLIGKLWDVAKNPPKASQRLRAAAALATYDRDNEAWAECGAAVTDDLVAENTLYLGWWGEAFRPVKTSLLPRLSTVFRDRRSQRIAERSSATSLSADYASGDPAVLAELLMNADEKQFAVLFPKFKENSERGIPLLTNKIDQKRPDRSMWLSSNPLEELAKQKANAAVALLRLDQPDKIWSLLKHDRDPRTRSYLIHHFSSLGSSPGPIIKRLDEEKDLTIRRALLLALGEFSDKEITLDARTPLVEKIQAIYENDPDPGLHAAAEWLLRKWGQENRIKRTNDSWAKDHSRQPNTLEQIKERLAKDGEKTPPMWYVNSQAQTMVVIPGPVKFMMGSPGTEDGRYDNEVQREVRIGRSFAVASKLVTVAQYTDTYAKKHGFTKKYAPSMDCPIISMTWFQAAGYCNWLSEVEKIPKNQWCYEIDETNKLLKLKAGYLGLTGYRLPTQAEMEYTTRAGAITSRYYGETEELLPKYAWFYRDSRDDRTQPVGKLKPNDLGLFDVHGNAYSWCQERFLRITAVKGVVEDKEDEELEIVGTQLRAVRGGSFNNQASHSRSAFFSSRVPGKQDTNVSIRPVRTILP